MTTRPTPPATTAPSPGAARRGARWAAAIALATAAALAAAEWHGRTSRRTFEPPGALARRRAARVPSAADALVRAIVPRDALDPSKHPPTPYGLEVDP